MPEEQKVTRKLKAILSADVKGYSLLMADDEAYTIRKLEEYRTRMSNLIGANSGRVVDAVGDNLLAEFSSAVDAVQCAVEIQKALKEKNDEIPEDKQLNFRIGINIGDVVQDGDKIYGSGVNVAARIEGLADPGGVCISRNVYDQIKDKLTLGYEYLGDHEVKNIKEPVRVYKVLMAPKDVGKLLGEKQQRTTKKWLFPAAIVAAILITSIVWYFVQVTNKAAIEPASVEKMVYPLPKKPSIAVLPFDNMSGDPEQEYFSDGITEDIITALSKTPKMLVIARNSTFTYKGKAVKVSQVAEELGVQYVLEGSVRKEGDRVRITAQLIDALAGHHLWAERYDRDFKDIFNLQDEITIKIVGSLRLELTDGQLAHLCSKGTKNLEAYLKLLQLRKPFYSLTKEGNAQARHLSEEAIALDPEYAAAYVYLGATHYLDITLGVSKSPKESLNNAFKYIKKAIALDSSLPEAYTQLGWLYVLTKQYEKGIAECERAIALSPNSANAHIWMGLVLTFAGRHEEAIGYSERALRIDPFPPQWYFRGLGLAYAWVGRYEEAISLLNKSLRLEPNDFLTNTWLTVIYSWAGRIDEANKQASEVLRIDPNYSIERFRKQLFYKKKEDNERYIEGLLKAGLPEHPPLELSDKPSIAVLAFDNLSGDSEQDYFSDGISEEIINALSKTNQLFVIARNSSFTYKGKPVNVKQVARELGVRYVLEGSVRKSEDRVRITAQLIDANTGHHLWSERYDRELKDIFAVQDEITMKILTSLEVKLTEGEQARIWAKKTKNLNYRFKHMEALSLFRKGTIESLTRYGELGQEMVEMEPDNSIGYRLMAWYNWGLFTRNNSPKESISKALKLARKALSIDESDAYSHALLGSVYLMMRQHEKAIAEGKRSIALYPNGAMLHQLLALTLSYAGELDEAIGHAKQGIRLNPFPAYYYFMHLGRCYLLKGQYDDALSAYKKALHRAPNARNIHISLAATYALLDRQEEAAAAVTKTLGIDPNFSVKRYLQWTPYKNQADLKTAIDALRKAGFPE